MLPLTFLHNVKISILIIKMNAYVFLFKRALWISVFLFALTLLFLFPFAFGIDLIKRFEVQIGAYWMIQEFVSALIILNMFKIEENGSLFDLYFSTRCLRSAIFFGKVIFTTLQIFTLQIPIILLWAILFHVDFYFLWKIFPTIVLSSLLFGFTSSLLGGFLYAITSKNQIKEILQPLLFFPLQSVVLLGSVSVCLLAHDQKTMLSWSMWWSVLFTYSIMLIGLSLIFGDMLFEE